MASTVLVSLDDLKRFIGGILTTFTVVVGGLVTLLTSSINRHIDGLGGRMQVIEEQLSDELRRLNSKFDETAKQIADLAVTGRTVVGRIPNDLTDRLGRMEERVPADLKVELSRLEQTVALVHAEVRRVGSGEMLSRLERTVALIPSNVHAEIANLGGALAGQLSGLRASVDQIAKSLAAKAVSEQGKSAGAGD
jgi:hypothetical protein